MFPIPFLGTCQQESQVCHVGWVLKRFDICMWHRSPCYMTYPQASWRLHQHLRVVLILVTRILCAKPLSVCSTHCMVSEWNLIVTIALSRFDHAGQYIGDDRARLPYSKIKEYGLRISGLPSSCALKHPSSYGKSTLRNIVDSRENLKLYGTLESKKYYVNCSGCEVIWIRHHPTI